MITIDDSGKYAAPRNRNDVWLSFAGQGAGSKPCELCGCDDWWIHSIDSGGVSAIPCLGEKTFMPVGIMSCESCHHVRMFAISSVLEAAGFGQNWKGAPEVPAAKEVA